MQDWRRDDSLVELDAQTILDEVLYLIDWAWKSPHN
jgi:hypothetical protein